jgi:hypothetical protein
MACIFIAYVCPVREFDQIFSHTNVGDSSTAGIRRRLSDNHLAVGPVYSDATVEIRELRLYRIGHVQLVRVELKIRLALAVS